MKKTENRWIKIVANANYYQLNGVIKRGVNLMPEIKQIKQQSFSDMKDWLVIYLKGIDLTTNSLRNVNHILDTYEGNEK